MIGTILAFILAAIPLYFAVKLLGGKTTFLNVLLVNIITAALFLVLKNIHFGTLIAFVLLIWVYREMFRLKWWKALVAWILQFLLIALFYAVLALLSTLAILATFAALF